ncbi:MAG: YfhO family protein [Candidatus Liptonbacteria bacterium]|nr:YfhO family protein [Candidatus Liptonbacteria bacterium]
MNTIRSFSNILSQVKNFVGRQSQSKKAFVFFAVLIGIVFFRIIINQQTFFSDGPGLPLSAGSYYYHGPKTFWDLDSTNWSHFEVPQTLYWSQELRKGHFAFWNPYQGNGQPLSASITSGIYNPLKLALFTLLPFLKTFDYYLLIRFLIAGFGAYLFLKKLRLSHQSALLGGVAYMFSAYFVLWITHWGFAADMMTPYLLLGIERLLSSPIIKNIFFLGIAWGIMVLSGNPEAVIIVTLLSLSYFVYRYFTSKISLRFTGRAFIFSLCVALIMSLPMLWDMSLFFSQGSGGQGHTVEWIDAYRAEHNHFLVQLEKFFHLPVPPTLFLEASIVGTSTMREDSLIVTYMGTFILLLTIAAFSFKKKTEHISSLVFFGGAASFFILMWLGVPPVSWLEWLPVLKRVTFFRYVGAFHFTLAILAAIGFENMKSQNVSLKKFWAILLSFLGPFTGLMVFSPSFRHSYKLVFNEIDLNKISLYIGRFPAPLQNFINWLIHNPYSVAALVFGTTFFFLLLFLFLWKKKLFNLIFVFLIVEMVFYIPKLRDTSNLQDLYREPPFVVYLKSRPDVDSYRILAIGRTLMEHIPTGYGLKNMGNYEGVLLQSYVNSLKPLFDGGFLKRESDMYVFGEADKLGDINFVPLFNVASVKYIVSEKPLPKDAPYPLVYDHEVKIYENKTALPIARIETEDGQALKDVIISHREPNRVTLETHAARDGLLVLAETNYPGWRVFVDGKESQIITAHTTFRGVRLSRGDHLIDFTYWPFSAATFRTIFNPYFSPISI